LKGLGIETVSNLPGVGRNLQDHLVLKVNYNCTRLNSILVIYGSADSYRYI